MSEECSIDDGATDVIDAPRLYAEHWHAMVRLAFLLTDSKSAAEDLVQDAFIALHRAAARIAEPGAAMAYVRAAIVNRSRSEVRRAVVARKHLSAVARDESVPGADRPALADAENQRVLDALRTLPTRQREVLIMRYWRGRAHPALRLATLSDAAARCRRCTDHRRRDGNPDRTARQACTGGAGWGHRVDDPGAADRVVRQRELRGVD